MAVTTEFQSEQAGPVPTLVTLPAAANELIRKGCLVCRDSSGRAVEGANNEGLAAMGWARAVCDNRTTAPEGGGAAAINCEIECGVRAFAYNGTKPKAGEVVYVYDNCTVTLDDDTDQNGLAGYCAGNAPISTQVMVQMGPTVVGQIVIAASEASQLDTAQTEIQALEDSALTAQACIAIPISSWRDAAGGPLLTFVDGSVDGLSLVDSECIGLRFNPVGEDATYVFYNSVAMPQDLDDGEDVVIHALAFRVGAADTTTVITFSAFFQTVGAAHTADADCGGNTAALDAATTVVGEYTRTIAAADVPAAPCNLTLSMAPSSALDADDLVICATWLEYTRKLLTA